MPIFRNVTTAAETGDEIATAAVLVAPASPLQASFVTVEATPVLNNTVIPNPIPCESIVGTNDSKADREHAQPRSITTVALTVRKQNDHPETPALANPRNPKSFPIPQWTGALVSGERNAQDSATSGAHGLLGEHTSFGVGIYEDAFLFNGSTKGLVVLNETDIRPEHYPLLTMGAWVAESTIQAQKHLLRMAHI